VSHLSKKTNEEKGITFSKKAYFSQVIWQIAFADIVFSIDNVISAVSFSEKTAIVILGVFIGMLSMLFITPLLSKLIHTYKGMSQAAYTIVGLVGLSLVVQTFFHKEMGEVGKGLVIASIIVFTLCYEHSSHLRRVSNPFLRGVQLFLSIPREFFFLLRQIFIVIWKK